jgi:short-subunit dehydrogenase
VHVGVVLPGFIRTEGFPADELRAKLATRWIVSEPEAAAEAIYQAGPGGKAERYVPRGYWLAAAGRLLLPALVRRATAGGTFSPATRLSSQDA